MDLGLRSAVGNQAGPGIRQLRSDLGCHYHMGCSIETSLKSLLFLVLFPEGVSGDGSLSFAHVTTKLAVSPDKQKSGALLPIALFSEASQCNIGQYKTGHICNFHHFKLPLRVCGFEVSFLLQV